MNVRLAVAGGSAAGLASGWNISNTGAVAQQLAHTYGVSLATVGLFTTSLFVMHLLLQLPAGRASDRYGERRVALAGLVVARAVRDRDRRRGRRARSPRPLPAGRAPRAP